MQRIPLNKGLVTFVDDADYEAVIAAGSWRAQFSAEPLVYAIRYTRREDGTPFNQALHTFLTGWPLVDHRDGDGLNNQRANLRPATTSQNLANSRIRRDNTSGFKGVSQQPDHGGWRARIKVNGRERFIGLFPTAEGAARAYDGAAVEAFGEYARLNFPDPLPKPQACAECGAVLKPPYCPCISQLMLQAAKAPLIMVTPHADGTVTVSHTLGRTS